ncbi:cysteine-rich RLK (RECEPTOR-like protein kinase) 8 [Hibiscus trionum]|uniref:Cysteine-rich RLK (RECEPTOR-like protein kinase) 8 n=1 Tax=Hibiscus trionum TaxID=183268 RepID=A0A9W7HFF1_HIBTR|nr:cysteine-rich RLK (RECEPTOR-like protein kinase) 8 [Hibiscus trionum]
MITRSKANIFKPKAYLLHKKVAKIPKHVTVFKALKDIGWRAAVQAEYSAMLDNGTWELQALPLSRKLVGCKWMFKVKRKPDDSVERLKARLVAKGYSHNAGCDFRETYSPVVRSSTIKTVLATTVEKKWTLRQIDINITFLDGELTEEIYMS